MKVKHDNQVENGTPLDRIEALSDRMSRSVDKVNDFIVAVETKLRASELGVEAFPVQLASSPLNDDEIEVGGDREVTYLGYVMVGDEGRIVVGVRNDDEPKRWKQIKPLVECPKPTWLEAIERLPDLLEGIADEAEKKVGTVERIAGLFPE